MNGAARGFTRPGLTVSDDRFWSAFVSALHDGDAHDTGAGPDETRAVDLRRSLDGLASVDRHYRALVEVLPCVAFVAEWDGTLRFRYVAPQIEEMLGFRQDDWLSGRPLWEERLHPDDRRKVVAETGRSWAEYRGLNIEYRLLDREGREVWVRHETAAPPRAGEGRRWALGTFTETTGQRRAERALVDERERARRYLDLLSSESGDPGAGTFDSVTGLPSRAMLEERLETALAAAEEAGGELAVLCVDIDAFKLVNDSLGHAAGNALLSSFGSRLCELVGPEDTVGRPGGDEFFVLLTRLDRDAEGAAEVTAQRLAGALEKPFDLEGMEFEVGASVGASIFPRDARSADALLKHADAAMYEAKVGGPGGFAVYTGGTLEAYERLSETTRLRHAVSGRELVLHYQPIFSLHSGEVSALEALVRWQHPKRGLLPPLDFIPLAEQTGLIEAVGDWVIEAMCAQARAWRDQGLEANLSFNVSPRQLRRRDFAHMLEERVSAHGLDPSGLTMEITESMAMQQEPKRIEPLLRHLRDTGLRLAIDDFGSGYSSLARLRRLPVQELKIDRAFMSGLPADAEGAGIVSAALRLAEALGMDAVAEGVETEAQRDFLVREGCRLAQGFHLARPAPAEEAAARLAGRDPAAR